MSLVLENDTCRDSSECVNVIYIVFRYVIYIVTKFIKFKNLKYRAQNCLNAVVTELICIRF
jgi:hypothetical protein